MITVPYLIVRDGDDGSFGYVQTPTKIFRAGSLPRKYNKPPVGIWLAQWQESTPKHPNGVYMLTNTPNETASEIHIGNFCGDVALGYKSDVTGCTILGLDEDDVTVISSINGSNLKQHVLKFGTSGQAIRAFNQEMNKQDFLFEVKIQNGVA